jgi:diguanylate cyclase (GGDEF)-like protein
MSSHPSRVRRPVVLIVDDHEWSTRSLESVLTPAGYAVVRAYTGADGLKQARTDAPDLMLININLPDGSGVGLCHRLRADPKFGPSIPIIVTSLGRPYRKQRLAALEAGAWDFLTYPLDAQELLFKLDAYGRAKFEADRIWRESLVDRLTGLYNMRGLERRAQELRSLAHRGRRSLACVVLAPVLASDDDEEAANAAVVRLAKTLKALGRASDAIGRSGKTELVVLAPSTDADGAEKLAERLAVAIRSAQKEQFRVPFRLRVGYDAVANVWEKPAEAQDLLPHATIALRRAMAADSGEWLQPFEPRAALS